jgi:hypothetical protein
MFCDIYFIYYQICEYQHNWPIDRRETEGFASTQLPTSEVGSRRAWLYRKPGIGFNRLAPRHMLSWRMLETAGTRFRYNNKSNYGKPFVHLIK